MAQKNDEVKELMLNLSNMEQNTVESQNNLKKLTIDHVQLTEAHKTMLEMYEKLVAESKVQYQEMNLHINILKQEISHRIRTEDSLRDNTNQRLDNINNRKDCL